MVPGDTTTVTVTQRDPDAAYVAALREALHDRGIAVLGRRTDTTAAGDTLVRLDSPPLREVLPALLKPSQNQIAEMIFRTTALERAGVGRADSARAIETRQLEEWGAAPDGFQIRDGSGLSRYDYVSPRTLMVVLDVMRRAPGFADYYAALPIAGVDGTIDYRMKGTPAEGNVHAKTGTLSNARSLSGYVTSADGRMLQFVVLCNNYTVPTREVTRVQDAMGVARASLRR
jgi:D-alanyl-D-alanine carboxypeptidase/D-alanyl-D-alanine-endopeptidase (penicillin-binding protein 4)